MSGDLLAWAKRLQAIAHNGLVYAEDDYDLERYRALQAIVAEMLGGAGYSPQQAASILDADVGYITPKVDVRAAIFKDDHILLVKERSDGRWTLPGGWADIGDSPAQVAVRETREESGYEVQISKLAAVYDRDAAYHGHPPHPHYVYKLFFVGAIIGGEAATSRETDGVALFEEEDIPPLSLARVTPGEIARMFVHHRQPGLPTDYD